MHDPKDSEKDERGLLSPSVDSYATGRTAPQLLSSPHWKEVTDRHLVELLPCGVVELDAMGVATYCNPAFQAQCGLSFDQIVGWPLWHHCPTPQDELQVRATLAEWMSNLGARAWCGANWSLADGATERFCWQATVCRDASGEAVRVVLVTMPLLPSAAAEGAIAPPTDASAPASVERRAEERAMALTESVARLEREIEQRRAAEEAQARLVAILETTPDFVGITDAAHRVVYINRGGREMYGIAEDEEVTNLTLADLTTPKSLADIINVRIPTAVHEKYWQGETVLHGRDGRRTPVSQVVLVHRDSSGQVAYYSTIARDLSARVADEAALRAQHRRLRDILDGMVTFAALIAKDGTVLEINRSVVEASGYSREEILGEHIADTNWWNYSPEARQQIVDKLDEAASGKTAKFDAMCRSRDGAFMPAHGAFSPIFDAEGNVTEIVGSGIDMTARHDAEEAARRHLNDLAHVSRVALLGEMVGGIAHELNQPLTAITNFADACASELADANGDLPNVRKSLTRISAEALRAGGIIRGLRSLVRKSDSHRASIDVNELLREVVELARADARERQIQIDMRLAAALPSISADRIQIQQVVLNLLSNAFEAMAETPRAERRVEIQSAWRAPDIVEVSVADHGRGFDHREAERLFDAFYTTKNDGLGLGLSTSRAIVDAHGGRLCAEATSPRGATFRLQLPPVASDADEKKNGT